MLELFYKTTDRSDVTEVASIYKQPVIHSWFCDIFTAALKRKYCLSSYNSPLLSDREERDMSGRKCFCTLACWLTQSAKQITKQLGLIPMVINNVSRRVLRVSAIITVTWEKIREGVNACKKKKKKPCRLHGNEAVIRRDMFINIRNRRNSWVGWNKVE